MTSERQAPWRPSLVDGAIAVGVVLRLVQYLGDRSLWLDEAFLAHSIVGRSAVELARLPLYDGQVAPLGFVELERLHVTVFGSGELALRFWPFLAGLAALVLFARLARLLVPEVAAGAVALFAVAPPLVYYSAEVKPYAFDLCAAVVLALVAATMVATRLTPVRWAVAAFIGVVAPWLALTAVFSLTATAIIVCAHTWTVGRRRERAQAISLAALWATSVVLALLDERRRMDPTVLGFMHQYWAAWFFPLPPRSFHDVTWLVRFASDLYEQLFAFPIPLLIAAIAAIGVVHMVRGHRAVGMAVVLPMIFALGASALHQYPLQGRLALFLAPLSVLAVASAISLVAGVPRLGMGSAVAAFAVLLVVPIVTFARNPTAAREEIRPVVAQLAVRRRPGDVIFVYCAADIPFRYYAARYGIPTDSTDFDACERARLDRYRGRRRVWVIASHYKSGGAYESPASLAGYAATIGRPADSILAVGAWARLYDLSDTTGRPASAAGSKP